MDAIRPTTSDEYSLSDESIEAAREDIVRAQLEVSADQLHHAARDPQERTESI